MGQKILVVEDNELNLKLFCDLLRAHGYAAEPVRDGREAMARARAFAPDLIVMDIQMPHISGLELIEQLKADADLRGTPIMAVTAYAAKGDEERIRGAGAEGYVSKPISVPRFVESVRALLAAPRPAVEEAAGETEAGDPMRHPGEGRDLVENTAPEWTGDPGLRRGDGDTPPGAHEETPPPEGQERVGEDAAGSQSAPPSVGADEGAAPPEGAPPRLI